jgi:hypothetical protein
MSEIIDFIVSLGYDGSFFVDKQQIPVSKFSYETHQAPSLGNVFADEYVNNFLFTPK